MEILISPKGQRNFIATIVIGEKIYSKWLLHSAPSWMRYCETYGLGLIIFKESLIEPDHPKWKKPTWQKLLIGEKLLESSIDVDFVSFLDADIAISPFAPNVFDFVRKDSVALVSLRTNLPFQDLMVKKRLAFLRNRFVSARYPLDSALFISIDDLYKWHNLKPQLDEACMGLFIFEPKKLGKLMKSWFLQYDCGVESITDGGDQTHFNYFLQKYCSINWLPYEFQAIWAYEMAYYYSFLYREKSVPIELGRRCLISCLSRNFFIHFAGSWGESDYWTLCGEDLELEFQTEFEGFQDYYKAPYQGLPQGVCKPENAD